MDMVVFYESNPKHSVPLLIPLPYENQKQPTGSEYYDLVFRAINYNDIFYQIM